MKDKTEIKVRETNTYAELNKQNCNILLQIHKNQLYTVESKMKAQGMLC